MALFLIPRSAGADAIVLESYTGKRPDEAGQLLAVLHDELSRRAYTSGDAIGRVYERRVSRPAATPDGLPRDFEAQIDAGMRAWAAGRFDEAVRKLVPLVSAAQANASSIAHNQTLRQRVLDALTALALSHHRTGEVAAARDTFQEMLRSFPGALISRTKYGAEAYQLFETVRADLTKAGTGKLTVNVSSASAVLFINERFENLGSISKADMLPGTYRVFVQVARQASRVYDVDVRAKQETVLEIDLEYESTLRTRGAGVGFEWPDAVARDKNEPRYAARFAKELGASAVAVVGIDVVRGRAVLVGSVVDLQSTKEIRRASVALEPVPTATRIRSLAAFLAGERPADGLDVEIGAGAAPDPDADEEDEEEDAASDEDDDADEEDEPREAVGSGRSWMLWTGIGGIALGAIAGGGFTSKFLLDARDARDELDRACAVSCTSEQVRALERQQATANRNAIISGVAGGAIVLTGAVFVVVSRIAPTRSNSIAVVPRAGGVYASYTISF